MAGFRAIRTTATTMPEAASGAALLRLMAWLSPAFPVGSFSYSHGLESAAHDGLVTSRDDLADWLAALLEMGSGWNDAVLCAEAWRRAEGGDLDELAELAAALSGSAERHRETVLQGAAFLEAAAAWPNPALARLPADCPYSIAVGAAAAGGGAPLPDALAAYLHAFTSNIVQAAIRLGVIGQTGAVGLLAALEPRLIGLAQRAAACSLQDLGGCALVAEIAAMRHEVQETRLFRS
jgi:urease accessory protein